jgi:hypothetical protein
MDETYYHPTDPPQVVTTVQARDALLASDPLWRDHPYEEGEYGGELEDAGDATSVLTRVITDGTIDVVAYVIWPSAASGGLIYAEASHSEYYTGNWSKQAEIPFEGSNRCSVFKFGGGPFKAIRLRVAQVIQGGPVCVVYDWSWKS